MKKQVIMRAGAFLGVLFVAAVLTLRACAGDVDPVEVARVRSPDGQVDAVATESRSGRIGQRSDMGLPRSGRHFHYA